ncbi:MAG: TMEM165/GDT1 family protein [Oculatellaceae cyanobacterium Prado106]|jgi:putative Ca2+/H+ antiporter (TMEM165/GDT1 family)|nr:TMEM165/GDT1 family protein [Oculatellaceae cyanobacterium Prado106]
MLEAFTKGLSLITVSELGDKTFFIAAILAMKHPRKWVFLGAIAALFAMTVLSVLLGNMVAFLPAVMVRWGEILLFMGFGIKLLLEARHLPNQPNVEEQQEAAEAVAKAEGQGKKARWGQMAIAVNAFWLTFVAEWGDRTQIATITLAAANNAVGVTVGATLGHAICAAIAVMCGRLVCRRISERTITFLGGVLFLLFASISLLDLVRG